MRRFVAPVFFLSLTLVLFGLASAALALPKFDKVLISPNTFTGRFSLNERGNLAYVGRDVQGNPQIFLWVQGVTLQITNITDPNLHFGIDNVKLNNQGQIIWSIMDYDDDSHGNRNVYLYDGGTVKQLNDNKGRYGVTNKNPSLNNRGQVAWVQDLGAFPWNIYLYADNTVTQITSGDNQHDSPVLNDSGYLLWWTKLSGTEQYMISLKYGDSIKAITGWGKYTWHSINNLNWIMYMNSSLTNNVYLYDPDTGNATKITNNGGDTNFTSAPTRLNNDNQVLANCSKYNPGRNDLYLYSLAGVTQVTFDAQVGYDKFNLADGGWVAYVDGLNLYVYRRGERLLLDPTGWWGTPQINSRGQVAYQAQTSPDVFIIYLASPHVSLPGPGLLLLQ